LMERFFESPEGQAYLKGAPDMGFWAAQTICYSFTYAETTIPKMTAADVGYLLESIFPRKISLSSREEAEDALPELIAFWEYLKRAYRLQNAPAILTYLRSVHPDDFVRNMFDSSRFGMAKSFFMAGNAAGFDMTDEDELNTFMHLQNAAARTGSPLDFREPSQSSGVRPTKDQAKRRRKRKAARVARKKRRKKKRK